MGKLADRNMVSRIVILTTVVAIAAAQVAATSGPLTKHLAHPTEPHCDQISINDPQSAWYRTNEWKYAGWVNGDCPNRFNFLNQEARLGSDAVQRTFGVSTDPSLDGIPTIQIAKGVNLPLTGLGTWQYNSSRTEAAVSAALKLGYVAIDTANDYSNQDGVGRALKSSGRKRESYFVTTKLEGGLGYEQTIKAHEENLRLLQLKYVDLLLVHFPTTMAPPIVGNTSTRQTQWKAMEALVHTGKARAIGTSHFCRRQMEDILQISKIRPAVNQVEFHVGMGSAGGNATDDRAFMEAHGIVFQSFSPLCGPCAAPDNTTLLTGELVTSIAKQQVVPKTGAQVSLRWQVQQGIPVIPKTD